ncbi:hypothetical protein PHJA_000030500 [Phtheirospermum japonicum]|uniref:Uncharacterized protein n=1 Tax=Phtheirospermum japonicum TaxID=374723 RepID=A0A830AWL3_9LAMI|nr:hypothetical protein PHJA_000030500 [Phtheirospermum japonicum]
MKSPKFLHRNQLSPQLPPPRISSIFSAYGRLNFASSITPRLLILRIVISIPIVSNRRWEVNINIDLLKIQGMFGPPRFLFTIKEEEREDLKSPAEKSLCTASKNKINDENIAGIHLLSRPPTIAPPSKPNIGGLQLSMTAALLPQTPPRRPSRGDARRPPGSPES